MDKKSVYLLAEGAIRKSPTRETGILIEQVVGAINSAIEETEQENKKLNRIIVHRRAASEELIA